MIQNTTIINDFKVESLLDRSKIKALEKFTGIKVNKSLIARDLGVSRKTVLKYYNGYVPSKKRCRSSVFDQYEEIIDSLLSSKKKNIHYKKNLYDYLLSHYPITQSYSAFRKYISNHSKFKNYFNTKKSIQPTVRFETVEGEQAQLDWKENMRFIDKFGVVYYINILVVLLGYSGFRYYGVTFNKSQDILLHHLKKHFKPLEVYLKHY